MLHDESHASAARQRTSQDSPNWKLSAFDSSVPLFSQLPPQRRAAVYEGSRAASQRELVESRILLGGRWFCGGVSGGLIRLGTGFQELEKGRQRQEIDAGRAEDQPGVAEDHIHQRHEYGADHGEAAVDAPGQMKKRSLLSLANIAMPVANGKPIRKEAGAINARQATTRKR